MDKVDRFGINIAYHTTMDDPLFQNDPRWDSPPMRAWRASMQERAFELIAARPLQFDWNIVECSQRTKRWLAVFFADEQTVYMTKQRGPTANKWQAVSSGTWEEELL